MKITRAQLKQVIKEEIARTLAEDGGVTPEDTDLEDEWFPGETISDEPEVEPEVEPEPLAESAAALGTIELGTVFGILAYKGATAVGKAAARILQRGHGNLENYVDRKTRQIKQEIRGSAEEQLDEFLLNDEELTRLVYKYDDLMAQVEKIKGKRGPEYSEIRAQRKLIGEELRVYAAEAIENAIQSVPSKERGAARSITRAGGYKREPSQVYTTGLRGKVRSRRGEE